ncbi:MAG: hypothetical protein WDZ60_06470, partial [Wenzhouxiangellaceae bacterium]
SHEHILYGMDFLRGECDDWFGQNRPPSQPATLIASRLAAAPQKLLPHDIWLERALGIIIAGPRGND